MSGKKIVRKCKGCEKEFEVLLIKVRQGKGLYCSNECYKTHRKENAKDVKYMHRIHQKKYNYGLTEEEEYLNLFTKQNNSCAICKTSFDEVRACVDHCHTKNKVRGLLCDKCNTGLGLFKDNISLLEKAINYLK